jgi:hypothetical protein
MDGERSTPVAGAIVSINGRYRGVTDDSGTFRVEGLLDAGDGFDITYVSAAGYTSDYRYIRGTTQTVPLYRPQRITAGESALVTVAPDDSLCVNNMQDSPGLGPDFVCRSLRVVALRDGVITVEARSTRDGTHPPLEVETEGVLPCCSERIANPTSVRVAAGTQLRVNVEIPASSPGSESFLVTTAVASE